MHKIRTTLSLKLLASFFFLFLHVSLAQPPNIDSLKQHLNIAKEDSVKVDIYYELAKDKIMHDDLPAALDYIRQGQTIANRSNDLNGQANFFVCLGFIYQHQSQYKRALEANNFALGIFEKQKKYTGVASMYNNIGNISFQMGNYPEALKNYISAFQQFEKIGEQSGMANSSGNIGNVYFSMGDYRKSLEYYFKSLKITQLLKDDFNMSNNLGNIGEIYLRQKNYKEGFAYIMQSLKLKEAVGDKIGAGNSEVNVGNILVEKAALNSNPDSIASLYAQAMAYYVHAIQGFKEAEFKNGIIAANTKIGSIHFKKKNYSAAEDYLLKSAEMSKQANELGLEQECLQLLSELYTENKKSEKALEYYKKYILIRDSLFSQDKSNEITRSEMNFEFDKKQAVEKAEQDKKEALAAEELKQQKFQRNSFIAGFALMLLLAGFIYRGYRQKQRTNIIIEQQKHEVEIQKELVEEKQKEIVDSITYAKRLQQAILPPAKLIDKHLPENFILYQPKDIVAGDFYWMEVINGTILIAAADCTGHGVPGAMVSVVCSNALNRTVKEFGISDPGKILDKVRELVIETFEKSESEVKDGMDISLCSIDLMKNEFKWAGANNPLWYFQDNQLMEITADKQPIGKTDNASAFTTRPIQLKKGEMLYLFTDGFADQFGGPKGKKFKYKPMKELIVTNSAKPMTVQKELLKTAIESWKGNLEQVDDILIIGIRI